MHHLSLGLKNFRCFENETTIDFAPISILTGPNNSGKSSFIKALLLLKDSLPSTFKRDITYRNKLNEIPFPKSLDFSNSSRHMLGSFNSVLNGNSNKFALSLPFIFAEVKGCPLGKLVLEYCLNKNENFLSKAKITLEDEELLCYTVRIEKDESLTYKSDINIGYILKILEKNKIERKPKKNKKGYSAVSTGVKVDLFNTKSEGLSNSSFETKGTAEYGQQLEESDNTILFDPNDSYYKEYSKSELNEIETELSIAQEKIIQDIIDHNGIITYSWDKRTSSPSNIELFVRRYFEKILISSYRDKTIPRHYALGTLMSHFDIIIGEKDDKHDIGFSTYGHVIVGFFDRLLEFNFKEYAKAFENTSYYPNPDVRFENLISEESGMIYKLLSDFLKMKDTNEDFIKNKYPILNHSYLFVLNVLDFLNIGKDLKVEMISDYGFDVSIIGDDEVIRLKDSGFGIRKLVSIILLIAAKSNNEASYYIEDGDIEFMPNTIILEEPESNLHPLLQSRLADLILYAAENFNAQFIIETHSEYFIRKLQFLTAKKESLKKGDVLIHYFYDKAKKLHPKTIKIQKDGMLTDVFGPGFFDEADNLAIDLFYINNSQKN